MVCRRYSRAYLRHLMQSGEALAATLNTIHNLAYYLGIMRGCARSSMHRPRRQRLPSPANFPALPIYTHRVSRRALMTTNSTQSRVPLAERNEVPVEVAILYDKLLADRGVVPNMFKAHVECARTWCWVSLPFCTD